VATGAFAVKRIAETTGILPATVFRTARTLREADPTLWPIAAKGGGRGGAHVEPRHLVNLAIALAAADPITAAPKVVVGYRALVCPNPHFSYPEDRMARRLSRLFVTAADCGGWLEGLVNELADADNDVAEELSARGFYVDLVGDLRIPTMRASYFPDGEASEREILLFQPQHPTPGLSRNRDPASNFLATDAPGAIMRTATLFMPLFVVLAELSDHTRRYRGDKPLNEILKQSQRDSRREARDRQSPTKRQSSSSPPDASANPEDENAATPARVAASPNQPYAERARPGLHTPRNVTTRERFLKRSAATAGPPFIKERSTDVRTRFTDPATA
jgi:hypothetical protein